MIRRHTAPPARRAPRAPARARTGLTLVELLTVVAIVGVLAAILIPTAAACHRQANTSREVAAARQLMVAFQLAADENRGLFISQNDPAKAVGVRNEQGDPVNPIAAARWPHRLRPYLGNRFKATLYVNRQAAYHDATLATPAGFTRDYVLSLGTTFGMNGLFVGEVKAANIRDASVKRMSEAALPSRLLAFASANGRDGSPPNLDMGYFRVEPPSNGWPAAELAGTPHDLALDAVYGYVAFRHGGRAVAAFLDGHVELLSCARLRDMRLWSDQARRQDDPDYRPAY